MNVGRIGVGNGNVMQPVSIESFSRTVEDSRLFQPKKKDNNKPLLRYQV